MEKIGILIACYGSRAASMVDAFTRSEYDVELYIADKLANPYNIERAKEHVVISDLSVQKICEFAKKHAEKINFAIADSEAPIIAGFRDVIEKETGIPVVCPTKEMALEESKVNQRRILEKCCPTANPRYKVYNKRDYSSEEELKKDLKKWLKELNNQVAVKPDRPGYGKGVGVWGDHFNSFEELYHHFTSIYEKDSVIVEEKIEGEETSLQCFCDGRKLVMLPNVRDYKRAFDGDLGPNTGGMGSYKDVIEYLPFMTQRDRDEEEEIANKLFSYLKKEGRGHELRGLALYLAFMHGRDGAKMLEINSRGGDPEFINIITTMRDDFVDVCFDMIDGTLKKVQIENKASVVTYKVPPSYGGFDKKYPDNENIKEAATPVDLTKAYRLEKEYKNKLKIYPGSLQIKEDGKYYTAGSRTIASVGIADTIEEARGISLQGIAAIKGGGLWHRNDIASKEHIKKSTEHMKKLRFKS